ncbi:MAG: CRTAC1 family protein, partial [bacterium]|nr:CRTAC1 family protein [bacterium]
IDGSRSNSFGGDVARNALYRNDGASFTDATDASGLGDARWGMGCAVADYDNDGDEDVYITNYGRNSFYENQGTGLYEDVTQRTRTGDPRFSTGCAFVDYDRDGDVDLYVANYVDFDRFMATTPERRYEWRGLTVHFGPRGIEGAADVLYRNEGDGTFVDATEAAGVVDHDLLFGLGVVAGDYNNDGLADIFVANDTGPNYLYQNSDGGVFTEMAWLRGVAFGSSGEAQGCMGIAFADFDNDLYVDLFVTNFWEETNTLYHNLEGAFFEDRTFDARLGLESFSFLAWGTEFFDADNDGDRDLFVANGHLFPQLNRANLGVSYAQPNQLFENSGDGTFEEISGTSGSGLRIKKVSRGAAFGDIDDDGDIDIAVLNLNDTPTLLRNDSGNGNNWLRVRTVGTSSNSDGIGARVTVRAGGRSQLGEVRSGGSYLSHSDRRLHFGLGTAGGVEQVEVRWPSGTVDRFRDMPVNTEFVAVEGSSASDHQY